MQNHIVEMRKVARKLPQVSGVYLMKDRLGQVIYVGKAKKSSEKGFQLFSGFAKICLGSAKDRGHDPNGS